MSDNIKEIEQIEDPHFTQGFNNGWIIAEHEPDVSKAVVANLQRVEKHQDLYFEGLQEGILHHELEKAKERFRDYKTPDRNDAHDKDKGRLKD